MAVGEMLDAGLEAMVDASASDVDNSAVDSGNTEVDTQETTEQSEEQSSDESSEDSSEADGKEQGADKAAGGDRAAGKGTEVALPKTITAAIKTLKESGDPELQSAAKILREAYFGKQAFEKELGSVKAARAFLAEIAGRPATLAEAQEVWSNHQGLIQNINESDALVHSGDPQIWQNIMSDLKDEGKLDEALPKLVNGGLESLKNYSNELFEEAFAPHFMEALESVGMGKAVGALDHWLSRISSTNGREGWKELDKTVRDMKGWFDNLKQNNSKEALANKKLDQERADFAKQKVEGQQKEATQFKQGVARECDSYSNKALGSALKPFLNMPFFKGFPRETLIDLGNGIKERLYAALEGDSTYQSQMKGQWGQKSPDKGKITEFHRTKLDAIAADIVEKTIKQRYPGFAKGGSAAGRVAAAKDKAAANAKASAQSVATSKPIYVATKPKELLRDDRIVKDWQMLEIAGKGYTKGTDGKLRFITWRR